MWNGTAATLKPKPISSRPRPSAAMSGSGFPASWAPMRTEVGRAGRAVDQGDAVEQEARGERPDQEVLERRLGGERVDAVVAGQDVHRHRHHLEAQEQDDEVLRPAQEHHAGGGQEDQRIVLGRQQLLALQVAEREQDGRAGGEQRDRRPPRSGTDRAPPSGPGRPARRRSTQSAARPAALNSTPAKLSHPASRLSSAVSCRQLTTSRTTSVQAVSRPPAGGPG